MEKKAVADRLREVKEIYQRLGATGINRGNTPELEPFFNAANEFVRNGESASGTLKFPNIERKFVYQLSTLKGKDSFAVFQFTGKTDA